MSKEWYEESSEEFAAGFTEERQIHRSKPDLEATYGPAAPFSEHKKGEHIRYISAEDKQLSGIIIWVQAATDTIGVKYVVAPDDPEGFLDFVVPGDVTMSPDLEQEQALSRCPWCGQLHQSDQVEQCPLKPQ